MPIHKGHLALIEFAKQQSESVIVSMSYTLNDPIDPNLRRSWIEQIFENQLNIELAFELDDFHDEGLPIFEATKLWAAFIKKRFPDIDAFACSEDYGAPLSQHLGLPCLVFDKERKQVPISATQIRTSPLKYWDSIPSVVQPYFVKKVCIYGPESTGKSTLSRALAKHFDTHFVHEVARDFVVTNDFSMDDILTIGRAQTAAVQAAILTANKILFCDTDIITTKIYSQHYLHAFPDELNALEAAVHYDLYCLMDIDVPWVADHLRDLGERREEMYNVFKNALEERGISYLKISGNWAERERKVIEAVNRWF